MSSLLFVPAGVSDCASKHLRDAAQTSSSVRSSWASWTASAGPASSPLSSHLDVDLAPHARPGDSF